MLPGVSRKAVQRPEPERRSTAFSGAIPPVAVRGRAGGSAPAPIGRDCLGWLATWPQERFEKHERAEGRCTLGKRTHELASGASEMGQDRQCATQQ